MLLYFIDAAFKISMLNLELFKHSLIRFAIGFFIVGIGFFYAHKIKLKTLIFLILGIVITDDVLDYLNNVDSFSPQIMLHSLFVLLWGSLIGYLTVKHFKKM